MASTALKIDPQYVDDHWPNFRLDNHHETSRQDDNYNCIAWVVGDTKECWWPSYYPGSYWPPGYPKEPTLENFTSVFEMFGYSICDDGNLENGYDKVAIYELNASVKHMAKQLSNGHWSSKLGDFEDIEHYGIDVVNGNLYGIVVRFMKRKSNLIDKLFRLLFLRR